MKILAVETATLTGGAALLEDDRLLGEVLLSVSVQHAERLMPAIERLLADAGSDVGSIDLFAVSIGPGSFTGLRVGIAAVQGLSYAAGRPALGVPTLAALALNASYFPGTVVTLLDARRGEVYAAAFRTDEMVLKEEAVAIEPLLDQVGRLPGPYLFLGEGVGTFRGPIEEFAGRSGGVIAPPLLWATRPSQVGRLALGMSRKGVVSPPIPHYLRPPV